MSLILIQALHALQTGLQIFLIASGLTLVLGAMRVINLAHGALYALGGYLGLSLLGLTDSLLWSAALICPLALATGLLLEGALFRPLVRAHPLEQVLLTFGLILVFEEARALIWGNDVLGVPIPVWLGGGIPLSDGLMYPRYRLAVCGLSAGIAAGLFFLLGRTRFGVQVAAMAENRSLLSAFGICPQRLCAQVFALGALLAMLAGLLAAPMTTLSPHQSGPALMASLVVVILGGLGSVRGCLIASLLVGLVDTLSHLWLSGAAGLAIYATMALALALRPQGLFTR
ncbi:MAG: branched-chain amino acid ABC transporter permease [Betaproteobacteria bacterium]|nr:branched-chain amino acid ABC transporter permease [Betaproteobacteria bacterium]NBT75774.1 branched-chain amino acid ABC transporter permease [Betaproteobacteria bacterium]NBY14115.1 branched-chain amino acid ABC transporter permease [Betaproteobacteria bacterium]NCA16573.1 branched-chain amino acid ABC transporter permease [Betaproteobacteria bacterium]